MLETLRYFCRRNLGESDKCNKMGNEVPKRGTTKEEITPSRTEGFRPIQLDLSQTLHYQVVASFSSRQVCSAGSHRTNPELPASDQPNKRRHDAAPPKLVASARMRAPKAGCPGNAPGADREVALRNAA